VKREIIIVLFLVGGVGLLLIDPITILNFFYIRGIEEINYFPIESPGAMIIYLFTQYYIYFVAIILILALSAYIYKENIKNICQNIIDYSLVRNKSNTMIVFLIVGIILRIFWIILTPLEPAGDPVKFIELGNGILNGGTFGDGYTFLPPGYPIIISIIFGIFGEKLIYLKIMNVILSIGISIMIYKLANILFSSTIGIFAFIVSLILPSQIEYTGWYNTEIPFTFFMLVSFYLVVKKPQELKTCIIIGVLLGISSLIRPTTLLFPFLYGIIIWQTTGEFILTLKKTVLIMVVSLIVISPWTYRNYKILNQVVPISTNGGWVFWTGNNPVGDGGFTTFPRDVYPFTDKSLNMAQLEKALYVEGFRTIIANPGEKIKKGINSMKYFWLRDDVASKHCLSKRHDNAILVLTFLIIDNTFYFIVLAGFIFYILKRMKEKLFIPSFGHWIILYFMAIHFLMFSIPRYRFPIMPFVIIYSSVFLISLISNNSHTNSLIKD